jgi:hypothetical protein
VATISATPAALIQKTLGFSSTQRVTTGVATINRKGKNHEQRYHKTHVD